MSDLWIVIPRWEEFQHRDVGRSKVPPWIKNLTRLLSDDDYLDLTWEQRGLLHGLWLEYARSLRHLRVVRAPSERQPTAGLGSLSRRLGRTVRFSQLEALRDAGFIELSAVRPASKVASTNDATLPVQKEKEKENPPTPTQATSNTRSRTNGTNPRSQGTNPRANPTTFPCPDCRYEAPTAGDLEDHRELVHTLEQAKGWNDL